MNKRTTLGLKKTAYFAALTASLAVGIAAARVPPVPPKAPGVITYYSNSSMMYEVGQEIVMCNGASYFTWGQGSAYKTQELFYCPPPLIE